MEGINPTKKPPGNEARPTRYSNEERFLEFMQQKRVEAGRRDEEKRKKMTTAAQSKKKRRKKRKARGKT